MCPELKNKIKLLKLFEKLFDYVQNTGTFIRNGSFSDKSRNSGDGLVRKIWKKSKKIEKMKKLHIIFKSVERKLGTTVAHLEVPLSGPAKKFRAWRL